jgi:hypothetical protein
VNVPAAASDVAETIEMSGIRRSINAAQGELAAGAGRVHAIAIAQAISSGREERPDVLVTGIST